MAPFLLNIAYVPYSSSAPMEIPTNYIWNFSFQSHMDFAQVSSPNLCNSPLAETPDLW
jgi:hypothetical protein